MNGEWLPFGQKRNRVYVAARNAHFQGEVDEQPSPAADSTTRYNFDISELLQGRIETSIINEETPAPAESPNYAMAA